MLPDKVCKTVHQYNKERVSLEDMKKLQEIADDYAKVKRYVYQRYGGVGSLSKIYPGYTVQNEMTESGFRNDLGGLPSVYFYLAIFDALGDIKGQWTRTKLRISKNITQNGNLNAEEKYYLRFVLKTNSALIAVLEEKPICLPQELGKKYDELAEKVEREKLHRYLCRQVRRCHSKCGESGAGQGSGKQGFSIAERAYRYGERGKDKGIFISTKESRKRIFIPLTDGNQYKCQLSIMLCPEQGKVEIMVPVRTTVHNHEDYVNEIGLAMDMFTMLTTQEGHCYGQELGNYQTEYGEWIRQQTTSYNRNRNDNPGRKNIMQRKNVWKKGFTAISIKR